MSETNRWKGLILGALGGIAGILAMHAYLKNVFRYLGYDPRKKQNENQEPQPFDDISVVGKHDTERILGNSIEQ